MGKPAGQVSSLTLIPSLCICGHFFFTLLPVWTETNILTLSLETAVIMSNIKDKQIKYKAIR